MKLRKVSFENLVVLLSPEAETAPEIEEMANEEEWRMLKDNQLWKKRTPIKKIAKTQHTREKQNQTGQQRRG